MTVRPPCSASRHQPFSTRSVRFNSPVMMSDRRSRRASTCASRSSSSVYGTDMLFTEPSSSVVTRPRYRRDTSRTYGTGRSSATRRRPQISSCVSQPLTHDTRPVTMLRCAVSRHTTGAGLQRPVAHRRRLHVGANNRAITSDLCRVVDRGPDPSGGRGQVAFHVPHVGKLLTQNLQATRSDLISHVAGHTRRHRYQPASPVGLRFEPMTSGL